MPHGRHAWPLEGGEGSMAHDDDVWKELQLQIENLLVQVAGGDSKRQRFLRRKLENWAINQGSGRASSIKARLKREAFKAQNGICAECGTPLIERHFELDRIDSRFADDEDQGYREGNMRGVHPHCNPRGPAPGGRHTK